MSAILEHLTKEQGFSLEQAKATLRLWELRPIVVDGSQVGELMLQNNEVHFALDRKHRLTLGRRRLIEETFKPLLKEKGFLVTKLYKGDRYTRLIEALGFTQVHSTEEANIFWINDGDPIRLGQRKGV